MLYTKEALSIEQQLEQLQERGLEIDDKPLARHYLAHVSYYRLAGYWWSMQKNKTTHVFKEKSLFSNVVNLYNFDRELRILLFDVIEKIEISPRTKLIYHLSHEFHPHWFENNQLFIDTQAHIKTLGTMSGEIDRSKDIFIRQHKYFSLFYLIIKHFVRALRKFHLSCV
jgi:abortive infection bacteriophage resistance protein